jgi:acyl carrier protein
VTHQDNAPWSETDSGAVTGVAVDARPATGDQRPLRVVQAVLSQFLADADRPIDGPIGPQTLIVDLGADSVSLLQIHTLLEDALGGTEIPTSALFDYPSVGELAAYLATLG